MSYYRTQTDIMEVQAAQEARAWKREMERSKETPLILCRDDQIDVVCQQIVVAADTKGGPAAIAVVEADAAYYGRGIVRAAIPQVEAEITARRRWLILEMRRVRALNMALRAMRTT